MTTVQTVHPGTQQVTTVPSWWWGSGVAAVVVYFCVAFFLPPGTAGESPADIAARYAEGRAGFLPGLYVGGLSIVLQLVFVGVVTAHLARPQHRLGALALVGAATGTAAAVLQLVGIAVIATLAYRTAAVAGQDVTFALYDLSTIVPMFGTVPEAVFIATTSVGMLTTARRRGWGALALAGFGLALAAAHLVSGATFRLPVGDRGADVFTVHGDFGFLVSMAFLLWMVLVSVVGFRARRRDLGRLGSREPQGVGHGA
jgi:hypothetical protein